MKCKQQSCLIQKMWGMEKNKEKQIYTHSRMIEINSNISVITMNTTDLCPELIDKNQYLG